MTYHFEIDHDSEFDEEEELGPSKSQLKREAHALQDLGREICALNDSELGKIPLDEELLGAIKTARKIRAHGGRKRQLQYIGKMLRNREIEPIQAAMDGIRNRGQREKLYFKQLETWRDQLLSGDDQVLQNYLDEHPQADRQQLRQLIRNAQREAAQNKPPKSSRVLFRYLREMAEGEE